MSITVDELEGGASSVATDDAETAPDRFVEQALVADKQEGLLLAVRARWLALAVIAVLLPLINWRFEVLYYEGLLVCFAVIGWLQLKLGRVGASRPELVVMFCDLALMTITLVVPNPLSHGTADWPAAMQYDFGNFLYFFILLSSATLAYSWRTVVAMGVWTAGLWIVGMIWVYFQPVTDPGLSNRILAAVNGNERMAEILDPNRIFFDERAQEVVIFMIVAATLALGGWRANRLLRSQAAVERERANLARYFSPNVVEELSNNDEPLKQTRTQNVAVLFVDIVGFTSLAEERSPREVIETLRAFHGRMEREVFGHNGTLDKYLGDGLMATFGTPSTTDSDATNALRCAKAMIEAVRIWNLERMADGEAMIQASFGLHYGEAVLGNIGAHRLEFAVIGNTVNVASRLENLTRALGVTMVTSDALAKQARMEIESVDGDFSELKEMPPQPIRGVAEPLPVWTLTRSMKK